MMVHNYIAQTERTVFFSWTLQKYFNAKASYISSWKRPSFSTTLVQYSLWDSIVYKTRLPIHTFKFAKNNKRRKRWNVYKA